MSFCNIVFKFGDRESQVLHFKREWPSVWHLLKCQIRFRGDIKFEIDSATSFKKTINDAQNTSSTKLGNLLSCLLLVAHQILPRWPLSNMFVPFTFAFTLVSNSTFVLLWLGFNYIDLCLCVCLFVCYRES